MKLLVFTDTHNSLAALKKIEEKARKFKPDIILSCGDFTIFMQHVEDVLRRVDALNIRTYIIHGNHEDEEIIAELCRGRRNIEFLHGKHTRHGDVLFLGYGGGGFSQKDNYFSRFEKMFDNAISQHKGCKKVLILHQPPYKSGIDYVYGANAGNKTTRNFIDRHKIEYVFAGHLHENSGKEAKSGYTIFINPGPEGKIVEIS